MCGICGIYSPSSALERPGAEIAAMLSAISHRGPDSHGSHVEDHLALGATRLAIIDLRGGDQPIYSEDRGVCAVYNGEIYNYRELQDGLRAKGHALASRSDSETLVHLYEDHGIDLVARLNGMFAFALWDARRGDLYLARDRFGIKPLYYRWDGKTLSFASEVKSLLEAGRASPVFDLDALVELLTFQNILSDKSLFEGVSLLPAGSVLKATPEGISLDRYWDPLPAPQSAGGRDEICAAIGEIFDGAVERQLVSDVEVASYLSGGLDTGAVTEAAVRSLPRLTTFSTGFDVSTAAGMEAGFDERSDAAGLATHLSTHHHDLLLDSHDMEMVLPRLVRHLEEPRMSFSYPNYLTAGMASRWVKVVLSGAGGDEIFGGYPWRYAIAGQPNFQDRYYEYWTRLLSTDELRAGLAPSVVEQVDLSRPRTVFDGIIAPAGDLPELDRILYLESKTFLHGLLIVEDKLSMAHSLESRVPFLDNELVDYVLTLPGQVKLDGAMSKDLFRKAMAGRLPPEVVSRKKTGFTPPQAAWFQTAQAPYLERILLSERARDRNIFRPEFVTQVMEEHTAGRANRRLVLWTLLCLEWWHRIFVDGEHVT